MNKKLNLILFVIIFLCLMLFYFTIIFKIIKSYDNLDFSNSEIMNKELEGEFYSLGFSKNFNFFTILFYADIIAVTISIIFFIILAFKLIRKREIEFDKKVLKIKAKRIVREMKERDLSDNEIKNIFRQKGWSEEDISSIMDRPVE